MEELARELSVYSEKVSQEEIHNMLNHLTKRSTPLFGFIDFSYIYSVLPSPIIIQRINNTLKFYVREKQAMLQLSNLLFPFRMGESTKMERKLSGMLPIPKVYVMGNENFVNFLIKEDLVELSFNVRRVLGKFIGTARAVDSRGGRHFAIVLNPDRFLEINLENHPSIYIEILEPIPKSISMKAQDPVFEDANTKIGMDSFDPIQHSLIVGESGSGKTKALFIMLKALEKKYGRNLRIVVLDPHGEFAKMMPGYRVVDFKSSYIEPLDIGGEKSPLMTQLISQLISGSIGEDNKYAERVLFYATYLLSSVDRLTLKDLSLLLTDPAVRMELTTKSDVDEARRFFDQEYQDIYIHHFNNAVLPILNFVGEYELYLGKEMRKEKLHDLVSQNNITLVSFDPNFFGKRMIKFLAGAIMNQMYILAITQKLMDKPTILVVDEFPRVETIVAKDILAETRKFNLSLYLSMQYLGQLSKPVLDAIVSNTRNIVSFKTNRVDATLVSSIMEIKLEEYFKKNRSTTELEESKKEMFVRLNQRECIVRLFDGKKYILPMKLMSVDMKKWMGAQARPDMRNPPPSQPPSAPPPGGQFTYRPKILERAAMQQKQDDAARQKPQEEKNAPAESSPSRNGGSDAFFSQKDGLESLKHEEKEEPAIQPPPSHETVLDEGNVPQWLRAQINGAKKSNALREETTAAEFGSESEFSDGQSRPDQMELLNEGENADFPAAPKVRKTARKTAPKPRKKK